MWLLRPLLVALAVASRGGALAAPSPPPTPVSAQCLSSACFALFWEARSFAEAGGVCQGGGGHLMTVRSSVAAEAIELLLRGKPGSAWLGLRLPEKACAEPAKQLRGFRWVAGDESTDYAAWASLNGTDVCGPRCVVVTQEMAWQERACDASADGFFCEYSYPGGMCGPLRLPPSAAASYLTPFGARESDLVAFPPGTTAEVPSMAFRLVCGARGGGGGGSPVAWRSDVPGAWACELENGGCEGQCRQDDAGRPSCTCPEGATLLEEDQRSCGSSCASLGCQHYCGSGVCVCSEGYALDADGRSCKDVDDCKARPSPCEQECVNTQGSFECRCWSGSELVDGKCPADDIEECFFLTCQYDCGLVNGKYQCICPEGFVPERGNPQNCARFCNKTECPAECNPQSGEHCFCPDGYILDYKNDETVVCADMDECESGRCGDLECVDRPGSYHCICPNGLLVQDDKLCVTKPDLSVPSLAPPKTSSGRGMLVAISVSVTLMVLGLVALLGYFMKKHHSVQTRTDYKCQQPVALQQVSPGHKL